MLGLAAVAGVGCSARPTHHALGPEAFAALPDQERQVVRLYYGLDDSELPSVESVAQRVGLSLGQLDGPWRVLCRNDSRVRMTDSAARRYLGVLPTVTRSSVQTTK
jgi:hypothetical protein